jgi:hypothetical protein
MLKRASADGLQCSDFFFLVQSYVPPAAIFLTSHAIPPSTYCLFQVPGIKHQSVGLQGRGIVHVLPKGLFGQALT